MGIINIKVVPFFSTNILVLYIRDKINNKQFIKRINTKFKDYKIKKTKNIIDLRTYENGVGETLSCGSASLCVASNFLSKKDDLITVKTFGGEITFKKIKDAILMKGPTTFIYKGNINE